MNNLDLLIPQPFEATDVFRFGVVTSMDPIRVQLDGDLSPVEATPIKTCDVGSADRVLVLIHNRQLMIVGRVSKFSAAYQLGDTENLNNLTDGRTYHQQLNVNADTARNYPEGRAGLLEVFNMSHLTGATEYIYQRYTIYNGSEVWVRTKYGNTWQPWRRTIGGTKTYDWTTVTGWDSTVELYNSGEPTRVCAVGGIVFLNGAMRWKSGTSGRIGVLPSWAQPEPSTIRAWRCQGSTNNSWGLEVDGSGNIKWGRYGPATPGTDNWLPFAVSWPQAGS